MGYSSGRKKFETEYAIFEVISMSDSTPSYLIIHALWNGLPSGPWMVTSKYLKLSSWGAADIPGAGSATRRSVSYGRINEHQLKPQIH